jgi:predicted enzyme related to lactoylglutathione lyase
MPVWTGPVWTDSIPSSGRYTVDILSSRTILHPADLARTIAFYHDGLCLAVAREFGRDDRRGIVFFAGGGLIEVVGAGPQFGRPGVALWLQVRSMDAAVDELAGRGIALVRPPALEPWGLIEAWIEDPDGVRIHLVEVPVDHPIRRDVRSASELSSPKGKP